MASVSGLDFACPSEADLLRAAVARFQADPVSALRGLRALPPGASTSHVRLGASYATLLSPEAAATLLKGGLFERIIESHASACEAAPSPPSGLAWQQLFELVDLVDPLLESHDLHDSPSIRRAFLEKLQLLLLLSGRGVAAAV